MHETVRLIYKTNGEIEKVTERDLSLSERREVEYKPLPEYVQPQLLHQIYLEPVIKVTEFSLTSSRMMTYLESMQAASIELAQLILVGQPRNDETLKKYFDHVISYHNYIQSLFAGESVSPEAVSQCPVNPRTLSEILQANWTMHEAFAALFKDSSIMPECISWRYETFRLLGQLLPSGYWVEFEEGYVLSQQLAIENQPVHEPGNPMIRVSSVPSTLWNSTSALKQNSKDDHEQNTFSY